MRRFYTGVVRHPKLVWFVFAALFVVCLLCQSLVGVNYDIKDYLPASSASTLALDVMEQEYGGGIPNARVLVEDVTVPEALEYKALLEQVEGVSSVSWLDDAADLTQPLEWIDQDTLETYYQDGGALFSVTIEEESILSACDAIREIIGGDNAMSGSAVTTAVSTTSTESEVPLIAVFGVLFALVVLLLTTKSWAEPFLVLIGLGVAVVLNMGSNLIFGEISFVTNAAGSILQLAVSLDYSVFLLHRFEECREGAASPEEAMVNALCGSTTSILSSGLTTVIGFLALCLMRYRLGADLGMALAKGVAISLITVFTFVPVLLLTTRKLVDKTRHRSLLPSFRGFGRAVCRVMLPLAALFALVIVPSYLASNSNDFYYGSSKIFGAETTLGADTAKIEETFGESDTYVLLVPKSSTATQKELSDALHQLPEVKSILSYVDTVGSEIPEEYLDGATLSQLNSENYTRMMLTVSVGYEGEDTFALIEEIRALAQTYYPDEYLLAGEGVSTLDLRDTVTSDMVKVNLLAIAAVFVVLLLTMRSVSLPVLLVLGIETAIWINLSVPYFRGTTIFYIAYLIISAVQLGATVDYAILLTDRYKQFREQLGKKQAVISTISSCTVSILTSGSVLTVVGFLLGLLSSHGLIAQLGMFLGVGALSSMVIVLFVLPGLLYVFDGLIRRTTLGIRFLNAKKEALK
ncbi:MAG: MMPL family transporter [Oscillospiraceae bacterium]|nr:MMPL family transporter [Oscillospiraceae bacterium]